MSSSSAEQPRRYPTMDEVIERLRTGFPQGGSVQFRTEFLPAEGDQPETDYLFVEQVFFNDESVDPDGDKAPEETLGQALYEDIDSAVNVARENGTLPGYDDAKFYEFQW